MKTTGAKSTTANRTKSATPSVQQETVSETATNQETEKLASQVQELTSLVQSLLEQNRKLQEEKEAQSQAPVKTTEASNSLFDSEETRLDIDPREYIRVISLTDGGLNLSTNTSVIRFNDFGVSKSVTFEDVRAIVDNHPVAAKEGAFLIQSEKAVKALYLTDEYEKMINKESVENIITLPIGEIKKTLDNVGSILKETIISRIIKGVIDGNPKYADRSKINDIGNHIGKDIFKIVQEIEENNK